MTNIEQGMPNCEVQEENGRAACLGGVSYKNACGDVR
jgi:hypothetical protein